MIYYLMRRKCKRCGKVGYIVDVTLGWCDACVRKQKLASSEYRYQRWLETRR